MLCHEFSFLLPRQFLKVSANVIQFKAFNVSSMGHATFSTFVGKAEVWWTLFISSLYSWQIAVAFSPIIYCPYFAIIANFLALWSIHRHVHVHVHFTIILCGIFLGHQPSVLLLKLRTVFPIHLFSKYVLFLDWLWNNNYTLIFDIVSKMFKGSDLTF